jgi:hypothetical protein
MGPSAAPVAGGRPSCRLGSALERAALLALPGFAPCEVGGDPVVVRVPLLAPALDPAALAGSDPARPGRGLRLVSGPPALLLPARRLSRLDLAPALAALAGLGERVDLELTLSRFPVDSVLLHAIDAADAALSAALYRLKGDARGTLRLDLLRARLAAWRRERAGMRLELALAAPNRPEADLAVLVTRLLFGPRPGEESGREGTIDLSLCLPLAAAERPALVPAPVSLATIAAGVPTRAVRAEPGAIRIGRDAAGRPVAIGRGDCARHTYVIGATGTGKSTLIAAMIAQDIAAGRAVILVDPHGDLYAQVRDALPPKVAARASLADAGDFADPFGLNLLEIAFEPAAVQRNFVANQLIGVFKSVLYRGVPEAFGPMFEAYFRNALLLLMESEGENASLADFDRVFGEATWRRELLGRCGDAQVVRFWTDIATKAGGEASLENIAPYICSKLTQFTGNPLLRPIIAARRTTLDIAGAMARGESCLVNLAKGLIGEYDALLLGGLVTIRIFCAAMARAALPPAKRRPVRLYLDEFATYATGVLAQMLAECRKFGLELVLANQSLAQVDGRGGSADVAHAILANAGSILAFRTGPEDARRLADWFHPEIAPETLSRLPDRTLVARLLEDGRPGPAQRVWTEIVK